MFAGDTVGKLAETPLVLPLPLDLGFSFCPSVPLIPRADASSHCTHFSVEATCQVVRLEGKIMD